MASCSSCLDKAHIFYQCAGMTNISRSPRGLAPSHLPALAHLRTRSYKANTNGPKRPTTALVGVCGPGDLMSSSHHQTVRKPEALLVSSSDSNFGPCWDFAFSRASILFVPLKHRSYSGLSLSTQISTDQATGAAIQISQLLLQPSLPHPYPQDPALSRCVMPTV